jgi:radical SAM protein with 4Fe4S-binding SPASM domain
MFIKDAFLIKMDLNSIFRIRRHPYSCQAFWHRGRITADGYLLGCDMFIAYPNYLEFSAGNVREKDPSALISSFLKEGGKELIADLFQKPSECIKCPYLKLCGGGCRAYSKLITGEWNTPECEIFRKIF